MSGPGAAIDQPGAVPGVAYLTALGTSSTSENKIPAGVSFVNVANPGSNTRLIYLPHGVPGSSVLVWVAGTGFELRTDVSSNIKINNVDSDSPQQAAIPNETLFEATYVSASQGWILTAWTKLGAPITAIVPD